MSTKHTPPPPEGLERLLYNFDQHNRAIADLTAQRDALRKALQEVHEFMQLDIRSGDDAMWTYEYQALFDTVEDALAAATGSRITSGEHQQTGAAIVPNQQDDGSKG